MGLQEEIVPRVGGVVERGQRVSIELISTEDGIGLDWDKDQREK